MSLFKKQRPSSILGLALDGNRLEAVVLRRSGSSLQLKETTTAALALSPLSGDPELVGREIRNLLDQAGIREKSCAVSIPASWVLTVQTKLPELPEADLASLLQIEAERGFPSGHESLYIMDSRCQTEGGEQFVTLMAIPRNHLETLDKALRAAQLKPLSFALGIAALEGPGKGQGGNSFTLALGNQTVELEVASGGGILALRSLDGAVEADGAQKQIDADLVARELRITLGQLPPAISESLRTLRVFARGELARQFANEIVPRAQSMGLRVELMERSSAAQFSSTPPPEIALSPALAVAANFVRGVMSGPDFLPPKVSQLQQFIKTRLGTRKLAWAGATAGAAVLIVCGMFLYQQVTLSYWGNKMAGISARVKEVQDAEDKIRVYRPWFDRSFRALRIIRQVTQAFPEDSSLTAKNITIHELAEVNCSGVATTTAAYRRMCDQLSTAPEVSEIKTERLTTTAGQPVQFTFNFLWQGGDTSGN